MELTSLQRKAVFAALVAALAALGIYMFVGARAAGPAGSPAARRSPAAPAGPGGTAPSSGTAPSVTGPAPTATAVSGPPDIYQWLPFSQAELASAAAVVTRFSADYGTFAYSESASAYVGSMRNLITTELSQVIANGYAVPGVAGQRAARKQVSAGTAVIDSLRAFGSSSMTFVVTISQQITDTGGRSRVSTQYAVTVTGAGTNWQVNDIELASAGNS